MPDAVPAFPAPPVAVFARANADARAARAWLSERFAASRDSGALDALTHDQQAEISLILTMDWWQAAAADEDRGSVEHADLLVELLPAAVRAASVIPHAGAVLALYLRNLINEAWELSWDHRLTRAAVEAAVITARGCPESDTDLVAWQLLQFMHHEFSVESALLTGHLQAVVRIAATAADAAAALHRNALRLDHAPGVAVILGEASNELHYYRAVHDIALATDALLTRRSTDAKAEIARIAAAIDGAGFRSVDASELRSHLASLEAVDAAVELAWLHVDEGRVQIVYGFGIAQGSDRGVGDLTDLRALVHAHADSGARLGGLRIDKVLRRLTLSDVWQGTDSLGRGYRGSTLQLEDLVLDGPGSSSAVRESLRIGVKVQISELGNHAVIFQIELENAAAHEVARVVNLATPVFGNLTEIPEALRLHPASAPDVRLSRLAGVVTAMLDDLRRLLRRLRDTADADPIATRAGSFGVIVTVTQASRDVAGSRTPLRSARELTDLWGAQPMLHPLPAGASGIADWVMYDVQQVVRHDLLHLNDEVLTANANVTLLASLRSPRYAVDEIESFITFAHSLHGMYQEWQSTVHEHAERIAALLRRVEHELSAADDAMAAADEPAQEQVLDRIGELVRVIERAELRLQSFVQSRQATMLFVESPTLVTSPALRTDLDAVLRSNRYELLREGFERAVRDVLGSRLQPLLEVCHRRIAMAVEGRQARQERRTERMTQVLGVVLAVLGVSGLVSVLQEGLELRGVITWWFVVAIIGASLCIGAAVMFDPKRRRRRGARRGRTRTNRSSIGTRA